MDSETLPRRDAATLSPGAPAALGRARFTRERNVEADRTTRTALCLPLEERIATPGGPMPVREYLRRTGRYACETHARIELLTLETITGHTVRATADTVFETPRGPRRARDLAPGDQVYVQSEPVTWSADRKLPCAVGTLRQWTPELGVFLARVCGASRWERDDDAGRLVLVFPTGDLARAVWTRERLATWVGRPAELEERADGNVVTATYAEVPGFAAALDVLLDRQRGFPAALFQAPADVVHAYVRTLLADRGVFEGSAVRVRGGRRLVAGLQEVLSYLGVFAILWADDGLEQDVDLLLPAESLERLPRAARPAGWPVPERAPVDGVVPRFVTTILRGRAEGATESFARLDGTASASLRGFLVAAS